MLKELTVEDIRNWGPCYDPVEKGYCKEDWKGTILDILNKRRVPEKDRIWCGVNYLSAKESRLFAVWCARRALSHIESPDPRSIEAVDVAERFVNGRDTVEELLAAYAAARVAAEVARSAAYDAVYDAADTAYRKERKAQLKYLRKLFKSKTN